jgi:hypothetical protein
MSKTRISFSIVLRMMDAEYMMRSTLVFYIDGFRHCEKVCI